MIFYDFNYLWAEAGLKAALWKAARTKNRERFRAVLDALIELDRRREANA